MDAAAVKCRHNFWPNARQTANREQRESQLWQMWHSAKAEEGEGEGEVGERMRGCTTQLQWERRAELVGAELCVPGPPGNLSRVLP